MNNEAHGANGPGLFRASGFLIVSQVLSPKCQQYATGKLVSSMYRHLRKILILVRRIIKGSCKDNPAPAEVAVAERV